MNRFFKIFSHISHTITNLNVLFQLVFSIIIGIAATWAYSVFIDEALPNWVAFVILIAIIICAAAIVLIINYTETRKLIKSNQNAIRDVSEKTKNYIDDVVSGGLIIHSQTIELIFSDDTLKHGVCESKNTVHLYNSHPSKPYTNYSFRVSSSDGLQLDENEYQIYRDTIADCNKITIPDENYIQSVCTQKHKRDDCGPDKKIWTYEISIPVNVAPQKSMCCIIIEKKCPSFSKFSQSAENCSTLTESMSNRISYPTDQFTFIIKLKEGELRDYVVKECTWVLDSAHVLSYNVFDHSKEIEENYVISLYERGDIPELSADKRQLEWIIPNPKIGCSFKIFFTLEKVR